MDAPDPSALDIKTFIPALTCCIQSWYTNFLNWERKIKQLKVENKENKIKYGKHDFGTKIHLLIIFKFISSSLDYLGFWSFGSEEKLVSLLVYSSFRLVATSGIRNSSVATTSSSFNSVSRAQIRSEYGVTPYSP